MRPTERAPTIRATLRLLSYALCAIVTLVGTFLIGYERGYRHGFADRTAPPVALLPNANDPCVGRYINLPRTQ